MQCCQVTCSVCEQVLALFPGSSPAFCRILYKTVCDKKLGMSLGTSSRYCSCHYMQCNANLIGLRCSCKVTTSCCFMTVNEYVNKAGYSCKLGVMCIYTLSARHHQYTLLKMMPIISFILINQIQYHFLQASGPSLPPLALDPLPALTSPSL